MRILHVIRDLDMAGGGPPVVALKLAAAQAALGHEAHLLAYRVPGSEGALQQTIATMPAAVQKLQYHWLSPLGKFEAFSAREAAGVLNVLVPTFDAVHLHGVWERVLIAAARAARRAGVPYLLAPHGMLDPWSLSQSATKKRFALALGVRRMLNGAHALHLLNADERDLLAPLKLSAPAAIIPNGIYPEELAHRPPAGAFRARHPQLGGRPIILFLSRLHFKKGLDHLADAFALLAPRVPEAVLVVAGPPGGAEGDFRARIAAAGLGSRVIETGPLFGTAKAEALVDATVFCLPSRQEGFSMAILEAMGTGLPVVISKQCHFPEVESAGAGHVVELSPPEIARALEAVLTDEALRRCQSEAAKRLVGERYLWPQIAELATSAYGATDRKSSKLQKA